MSHEETMNLMSELADTEEYKAYEAERREELMYELEAAFGKGTTVVNVLTGETYRL